MVPSGKQRAARPLAPREGDGASQDGQDGRDEEPSPEQTLLGVDRVPAGAAVPFVPSSPVAPAPRDRPSSAGAPPVPEPWGAEPGGTLFGAQALVPGPAMPFAAPGRREPAAGAGRDLPPPARPPLPRAAVPAPPVPSPWAAGAQARPSEPGQAWQPGQAATAAATAAARGRAAQMEPELRPPAPSPRGEPARGPAEVLDLLWFDPASVPRMRKKVPWRRLLDEFDRAPPDPVFEADPMKDPQQLEDHRDVFEILTRAEALDARQVGDALPAAVGAGGKFAPPLVLVAGEFVLLFDEIETLKATAAAATAFAAGDQSLKDALDSATEALGSPWLEGAGAVAEALTARVRKAFGQAQRPVAQGYLESTAERVLVERRAYQMRTVFGARSVRALLLGAGQSVSVPVYLPEHVAKLLPMCPRLRARLIAELHARQDHHEAFSAALRAVAMARVLPPLGGR
ncbi:MAG: hypothetical protein HY744_23435 [Deltaproteobacteria bacterium]|nr:hypothetical protein [Deltaproteobacteria bacterium]